MDFDDTRQQAAWRTEFRTWIADALTRVDANGLIPRAKQWQAAKYDAGPVIGSVHDGWNVAVTTLMNERSSLGSAGAATRSTLPAELAALGRQRGTMTDTSRQRVADVHIRSELQRFLSVRTLTSTLKGSQPGPGGSVAKLGATLLAVGSAQLGLDLLGPAGLLHEGDDARWVRRFLGYPGHRIGGGTDEVNRNVVAERVLGLPGEPRTDDTLPWRDVPR